ncbi:MAG: hypothetical protein ACM31C_28285 [Acidobacteriota bacterium]
MILASGAASARGSHERVAIIDLGPADDGAARRAIGTAAVAAGLDPVLGDGVDDALAGIAQPADDATLAVAMSQAKQAFGELDCAKATAAAQLAIGISAARQAAGIAPRELPRAWAYVLLCADRAGDDVGARLAATRLRELGGTAEVAASLLAKYPEVDSTADRDIVELEVTAEVPGAALWVDFQPAGSAPAKLPLTVGPHVIAAASGTRRGFVIGTAVRSQKSVTIAMPDQAGKHAALAAKVAGWHGKVPPAKELAAVLGEVGARVALVRHGGTVEVWGHAGEAEPLRLVGGPDGTRPLAEADRAAALAVDRAHTWNDRSPDPDQPLLVESREERAAHGKGEAPTKWWVYAAIAGAVVAGALVIVAHDTAGDTQRVTLHYP